MNARAVLSLFVLALAATAAYPETPYTKNVAVVIYDGVEVLDFAGPAEVFSVAAGFGEFDGQRAFNVYTVSRTKDPIVSQGFIDVIPDHSIEDSPKPDIIVLPGGSSGKVIGDPAFLAWVRTAAGDAENVLTVCTGAFIAGKAGLLDGGEATTWYGAVPRLAAQFPEATVHEGRRFVDGGKLITTAGVSAGIDGSLHFVARTLGRYVADRTAEYMEYRWTPEAFQTAKYAHQNPRLDARGRALQQGEIELRQGENDYALASFRSLVEKNPNDAAAWLGMGRTLHEMKRYEEALAAHRKAATSPAQRATALFNMACEYALLGRPAEAIEAAEGAVKAGFRTKWFYENEPDLASVRGDARFQTLLGTL